MVAIGERVVVGEAPVRANRGRVGERPVRGVRAVRSGAEAGRRAGAAGDEAVHLPLVDLLHLAGLRVVTVGGEVRGVVEDGGERAARLAIGRGLAAARARGARGVGAGRGLAVAPEVRVEGVVLHHDQHHVLDLRLLAHAAAAVLRVLAGVRARAAVRVVEGDVDAGAAAQRLAGGTDVVGVLRAVATAVAARGVAACRAVAVAATCRHRDEQAEHERCEREGVGAWAARTEDHLLFISCLFRPRSATVKCEGRMW